MTDELVNNLGAIRNKKVQTLTEENKELATKYDNLVVESSTLKAEKEALSTEVAKLHQEKCVEINEFCAATRAGTETDADTLKFCGENIPDYCEPSS
jgi:hypothetical protein